MQIEVEDVSPVEKRLQVTIPWDRVKDKLDKAYRDLGRDAQLRGFRKGKVPRSVLEQVYGKAVHREVARELVSESFVFAAEQNKLEPVAEPVIEEGDIKKGKEFAYSARVEIRAPVKVESWQGLEATRRPVSIEDKEVDHALEHLRMQHVEYRPIEGRSTTETSDELTVSLSGTVGDMPVERPELSVDLGHTDHEFLPGLSRALTGIPVGATEHGVSFTIPEDHEHTELAGKTAELTVTVADARIKVLPELDDEFAKDTGDADTLAELRKSLADKIETRVRQEIQEETRKSVLDALVGANPVELAPALVERGIDNQVQRTRYTFAMQGLDLDKAGIDMGRLRENLREPAMKEVRGQLLLDALAEEQDVQVTEDDIEKRIAELAQAREVPAVKLKAELTRSGDMEALRWRIRQDKTLDLVVEKATITERAPEELEETTE